MKAHLSLPWSWEDCIESDFCVNSVHCSLSAAQLNVLPREWVEELLDPLYYEIMPVYEKGSNSRLVTTYETVLVLKNRDNQRHSENGPAFIRKNGNEEWYRNGELHREDGPAKTFFNTREWHLNGKRHRLDGPAIVNGLSVRWYVKGRLHREDGPAMIIFPVKRPWEKEYSLPGKQWWVNGKRHREDGPAVIHQDGSEEWWLNGVKQPELALK